MPELTDEMFVARGDAGCKVAQFLAGLSETSRDVLERALGNDKVSHAKIAREIKAAGYEDPPGETGIRRHRSTPKGCSCQN